MNRANPLVIIDSPPPPPLIGVLQAERIPDGVRGRVLSLQNACLQAAAPAGIGLAGVVAEYRSPLAAGLAITGVWLAVVTAVALSRAWADIEPTGKTTSEQDLWIHGASAREGTAR